MIAGKAKKHKGKCCNTDRLWLSLICFLASEDIKQNGMIESKADKLNHLFNCLAGVWKQFTWSVT